MTNIVFGGCSYTWGQGLWYHGNFENDTHPRDGMYYGNMVCDECVQYMIENRFTTRISNHFKIQPKVSAINGGDNCGIINFCKNSIDEDTKLVLIQTTQFSRNNSKIDTQIEEYEKFVIDVEASGIPVRFIHWVWTDISEEEVELICSGVKNIPPMRNKLVESLTNSKMAVVRFPPEDCNKLPSKIIKDRTIQILGKHNFSEIVDWDYSKNGSELNKKYTIAGTFGITKENGSNSPDTHLNLDGHKLIADEVIDYLETQIKLEKIKL